MNKKNKFVVMEIIESFRGRLDDEWLDEYHSDAEHGEWGMALENLCTQLDEFDVQLSKREYQAINAAGESMGIDPQCWNFLVPTKGLSC